MQFHYFTDICKITSATNALTLVFKTDLFGTPLAGFDATFEAVDPEKKTFHFLPVTNLSKQEG